MIKEKTCAIIIPLYKSLSDLSDSELFSLKNTCVILQDYQQVLVGPKELIWEEYQALYKSYNLDVKIILFESEYFKNIAGYNLLLKSLNFYERLGEFDYILLFQTDAFVLKDELN